MSRCAWNEGCTEASVGKSSLCQVHRDEAIRLRKLKVAGWKAAKDARDSDHLAIVSAMLSAEKDAIFGAARLVDDGEFYGDVKLSVVVQRGALTNFLLGSNKGYVPQADWYGFNGGAAKDIANGVSLKAARAMADEYNARLGAVDADLIGKVVAVPRLAE